MARKKSTTKTSPRSKSGKGKKQAATKPRKVTASRAKTKADSSKKAGSATGQGKTKKATTTKKSSGIKSAGKTKTAAAKSTKPTKSVAKKSSTNNKAPKAKKATKIAKVSSTDDSYFDRPMRKTRLSSEDLDTFREMLLAKRAELVGDMTQLQSEALGRNRRDSAGDVSSMPTHMADIGSDNWEQEFTLGLIEGERTLILEIDEALDRINDRTYGICMATNKVIRKARLRAKPWAKYCIDHARKRELGLVR